MMKKIISLFAIMLSVCFTLGFFVSMIEKKNSKLGWVEGHKLYGPYEEHVKRPIDFALTLFAVILVWPILLIVAVAVRISMGSPVLFKQDRPGLGGKIFKIYKFRTMTNDRDAEGNLLSDEDRLTKVGVICRKSSLDEIPSVVNVLKGDLALVGPRPLLSDYLDRYNEEQAHRHDVRPGLTGFAQTGGRNLCSWDEKFKKDVEYVNHITFFGDLKILIKTIKVVLKREGISSETSATMEAFTGNEK